MQYVVSVWRSGVTGREKKVCSTPDDAFAYISSLDFDQYDRTRIDVEQVERMG